MDPLLTPAEAARLLGILPPTLTKWRNRRHPLKYVRIGNNTVMYRPQDVEAFIKSRIATGTDRPDPETVRRPSPRRQQPEEAVARMARQPKRRKR
jgi:hypothetical protein